MNESPRTNHVWFIDVKAASNKNFTKGKLEIPLEVQTSRIPHFSAKRAIAR
jgi:hypothetical protein